LYVLEDMYSSLIISNKIFLYNSNENTNTNSLNFIIRCF